MDRLTKTTTTKINMGSQDLKQFPPKYREWVLTNRPWWWTRNFFLKKTVLKNSGVTFHCTNSDQEKSIVVFLWLRQNMPDIFNPFISGPSRQSQVAACFTSKIFQTICVLHFLLMTLEAQNYSPFPATETLRTLRTFSRNLNVSQNISLRRPRKKYLFG